MYTWDDGMELYHHGILGMKWGIRRFQNEDGSLTPAGRERYAKKLTEYNDKAKKHEYKMRKREYEGEDALAKAKLDDFYPDAVRNSRTSVGRQNILYDLGEYYKNNIKVNNMINEIVSKYGKETLDEIMNSDVYKAGIEKTVQKWVNAAEDYDSKAYTLSKLNDQRAMVARRRSFENVIDDLGLNERFSKEEKEKAWSDYLKDPSGWEKKQYRQREKENRGDRIAGQSWGAHGSSGRYPFN